MYLANVRNPCHIPFINKCKTGNHNKEDYNAAVNRINFFRKLAGLPSIKKTRKRKEIRQQNQACMIMDNNNMFTHKLDNNSLECWTKDGMIGAKNSFIYSNINGACARDSIVSYIKDQKSHKLTHRRFILDPAFNQVALGVYGKYSTLRVSKGRRAKSEYDFIAYPSPGEFPIDLYTNTWSFSRKFDKTNPTNDMPSDTIVRVKFNGVSVPVNQELINSSKFGSPGIVRFELPITPLTDEKYKVIISSSSARKVWKYSVKFVDCNPLSSNAIEETYKTSYLIITVSSLVFVGLIFAALILIKKNKKKAYYARLTPL